MTIFLNGITHIKQTIPLILNQHRDKALRIKTKIKFLKQHVTWQQKGKMTVQVAD